MRLRSHPFGLALLVAIAIATAPTPAFAQSGDPEQGSPSGVIYEIPLDNARRDAAPSGGGGGGNGGGGSQSEGGSSSGGGGGTVSNTTAAGTTSPIRSENGFGSSSNVPGAQPSNASDNRGKRDGDKSGRGSGSSADGVKAPSQTTPAESLGNPKTATINPSPSKSRAYLLLGLALAVAAGIGVAGRFIARRR